MPILDKVGLLCFLTFLVLAVPTYVVAFAGAFGERFKVAFWLLVSIEAILGSVVIMMAYIAILSS